PAESTVAGASQSAADPRQLLTSPLPRLWRNLVDAHGSGPCGLTLVEVRVLSAASFRAPGAGRATYCCDTHKNLARRRRVRHIGDIRALLSRTPSLATAGFAGSDHDLAGARSGRRDRGGARVAAATSASQLGCGAGGYNQPRSS